MTGILYGIGVGPGDPELMTLKAVKAIRDCDVICLPKADKNKCMAYLIAVEAVPELKYKKIISFDFEMISDEQALEAMHKDFYNKYRTLLNEGYNLGFLTIGDPTIYSTFGYVMKLATADGVDVEIINGITSFCGTAAACGIVISEASESIHIISGQTDIDDALKLPGTKIIMKSGRNIANIKEKLIKLENDDKIIVNAVSDCGLETEQIFRGAMMIPDESKYMMTIIVKEKTR